MDFDQAAQRLAGTLASRGISDPRVLEAIARVPRHRFVSEDLWDRAYDDTALPIGSGQTISQPYIVALMTQELRLTGTERVLEIGTGSGYQAAILALLCRALVTVERHAELLRPAEAVLEALGFTNIEFRAGDGTLGCPDRAPFDGILVTAAAPDVPSPLYNQLAAGGRMVIPVGDRQAQNLVLVEKQADGHPLTRELCGCRFVQLIGEAGWPE
ncbi:MAG TPA: protein-L-isoaspartate(D-aspartate) O-methyltransferase [Planctomycetaceae bacterium]|nr:protein-L-isoaspartate(D-aspartate) O-methyltransferase [Planctomycetaceae bacterium]